MTCGCPCALALDIDMSAEDAYSCKSASGKSAHTISQDNAMCCAKLTFHKGDEKKTICVYNEVCRKHAPLAERCSGGRQS